MRILLFVLLLVNVSSGQQLMDQGKLNAVRASLPVFEDEDVQALVHDPRNVWYTSTEMPPAYQHRDPSGVVSLHSPSYNISADPSDSGLPHGAGGNANISTEPAWALTPGGTHKAIGVLSYKAFRLPEGKPVAVFNSDVPGRRGTGYTDRIYRWIFPRGTVFIEVVTQRIGDKDYPFEVRTRELYYPEGKGPEWETDSFMAVRNAGELANVLESFGEGEYRAEAIAMLRGDGNPRRLRLHTAHHNIRVAFDETATLTEMPTILTEDVKRIYDRPWVSVSGEDWQGDSPAPYSNKRQVGYVPPGYMGAFVKGDCTNCHQHVGLHATAFQYPRGWYGRVRGGGSSGAEDGILSWHPFEPSCISYSGGTIQPQFRRAFSGILETYDRSKHTVDDYRIGAGL